MCLLTQCRVESLQARWQAVERVPHQPGRGPADVTSAAGLRQNSTGGVLWPWGLSALMFNMFVSPHAGVTCCQFGPIAMARVLLRVVVGALLLASQASAFTHVRDLTPSRMHICTCVLTTYSSCLCCPRAIARGTHHAVAHADSACVATHSCAECGPKGRGTAS